MLDFDVGGATFKVQVARRSRFMDTVRFADVLRSLSAEPSRRDLARVLAGGTLAVPVLTLRNQADADAKKKRKNKKKKKRPKPGSARCPADTTFYGIAGCVENNARAAEEFSSASGTCHDARRRLLTGAELIAYVHEPGVTIEGFEWTGDIVVGSEGNPVALAVTDQSNIGFFPLIGEELPFRCVTLPLI
jgi:hypothetical protein